MLHRKSAGLIYGHAPHHIDHLAILCHIMAIPLLVTEEEIASSIKKYYPLVEVLCVDYLTIAHFLVSHYDIIFYSIPRDLFDDIFFFAQKLLQKKIHTVWCPHGNSDKGQNSLFMEVLKKEEVALVYGPKMIAFLKQKGVFNQLKHHVITGNFRYAFYLKHQPFYDAIVSHEILRKLPAAEKTILYAPTWQDYEQSSSFYEATIPLIEHLPAHWNLIIKPHPNLALQDAFKVESLLEPYENRPNLLCLNHFPPIYPLLNCIDIYIGDKSSIGYDFLTFNRPLFFLNTPDNVYLSQCGKSVPIDQYPQIYSLGLHSEDFSKIRQTVYNETFGPAKELEALKHEIEDAISHFPDPEINFF